MKEMGGHEARAPRSISIPKIPGIRLGPPPRSRPQKMPGKKKFSGKKRGKESCKAKLEKLAGVLVILMKNFSGSDEKAKEAYSEPSLRNLARKGFGTFGRFRK